MELRDLEAYGEPGATVYRADCLDLMRLMLAESVDAVFADPPYGCYDCWVYMGFEARTSKAST